MHFLFLKPDLHLGSSQHYAGGKHGFLAAAHALAAAGHSVHVLYQATKASLMFSAMQQGCMGSLSYSTAVEGVAVYAAQGITHHVSLSDAEASTAQQLSAAMAGLCGEAPHNGPSLSTACQRLMDEASALLRVPCWLVLDADGSQEPLPGCSNSLLVACAAALPPSKLLLLVQNIHFLPFGPQGTAARAPALLHAWSQLGAVLCVSNFVARYVAQHASLLGLSLERISCVHYAAFGAFGPGPFPDWGAAAAAQRLPCSPELFLSGNSGSSDGGAQNHLPTQPAAAAAQHQACSGPLLQPPTIGCLKLSPEKGAAVVLGLARALPRLQFLAVCADPDLAAAAAQLPNMRVVPPGDVNELLQHMNVLLAPSVWQEAYGMVVTEAVLRGVPVLVSDQGGVAEAALGCAAAVLPVSPMQLPVLPQPGSTAAGSTGPAVPSWRDRVLPEQQDLRGWVHALQQLLGSREAYQQCSRAGREAGLRLVGHQQQLLQQLVDWLARRQ